MVAVATPLATAVPSGPMRSPHVGTKGPALVLTFESEGEELAILREAGHSGCGRGCVGRPGNGRLGAYLMVSKRRGSVGVTGNADRMLPHAFLRLDSASTEDMLTDAAVHVLAAKGATGLTIRAVAEWLRVTPPRVSQLATRDHLIEVVTARFGIRWMNWIEHRRWREGALALLPAEPDEVAGVRVWLALAELARFNPRPAELLAYTRGREQVLVADLLEVEPDSADVTLVLATAQGLRAGLCESGGITLTAARSALEGLLGDRVHVTSHVESR